MRLMIARSRGSTRRSVPVGQAEVKWVYTSAKSLFGKYLSVIRKNGPTPDRAMFSAQDWAWRGKVNNLVDDYIEQGVWTADGYVELSIAAGKVLKIITRTLLTLRDFYGPMNSRTIAAHLRIAPRTAQAGLRELAELQLITFDRQGREMVNIQLAFGIFMGAKYERKSPRPPDPELLAKIRRRAAPRRVEKSDRAQDFALQYHQEQILTEESVRSDTMARAAEPAAPASAGSPQPPLHGRKEALRSCPPTEPPQEYGSNLDGFVGGHGSAKRTNDIERQRMQGIPKPDRRSFLGEAVRQVEAIFDEILGLRGPAPPS